MQYFAYLLSQYIAAVNTDSWEVVSCAVQNILRMAVVLSSFKFVVHGKKLLRNNCCFLAWFIMILSARQIQNTTIPLLKLESMNKVVIK